MNLFCGFRGLDFPAVDWVVQLDCPEDGVTYVHRYNYPLCFSLLYS